MVGEVLIEQIIVLIVGMVGSYFVGRWQTNKEEKAARELEREALQVVLRMLILHVRKEGMKNGFITMDELDAVNVCFERYKKLGKNGVMERVMSDINSLPIRNLQ